MKIGLTIKAVIRWEQLREKSFSQMDYADSEDVEALLYTCTVGISEELEYTFDVFKSTLSNKKRTREMLRCIERQSAVIRQFQKAPKSHEGVGVEEKGIATVGSIVSTLIMAGLDAHYALNEMELCDLPLFIDAYERRRKEEMESARMWTYLNILPHVDSKKLPNGAKDLITFPWEGVLSTEKDVTDYEIERFETFMKEGKKLFK